MAYTPRPGNDGSSEWGGITGTLSDQTDLQGQLDLKSSLLRFSYTNSSLGNGQFTTDNAVLSSTTTVTFNSQSIGGSGVSNIFERVPAGSSMVMSGVDGICGVLQINSATDDGYGNVIITVGNVSGNVTWEGIYSVSFLPGPVPDPPTSPIQLPVFTYVTGGTGDISNGQFSFDGSSTLYLSHFSKNSDCDVGAVLNGAGFSLQGRVLVLTDPTGKIYAFTITPPTGSFADNGSYVTIAASGSPYSDSTALQDGVDYYLSFWPASPLTPTLPTVLTASGITPVADGTYTTGIGPFSNGTITIQSGIITAVTQAA